MNELSRLKPAAGALKKKRRIGRGVGSGSGKTAGKGQKGQKARSGGSVPPGFEGGQMPIQRRLPKFGFTNIRRVAFTVINLRDLDRFDSGAVVDMDALAAAGLIRGKGQPLKVLGSGEISKSLTVKANAFSGSARTKIEAAGGSVEVVGG